MKCENFQTIARKHFRWNMDNKILFKYAKWVQESLIETVLNVLQARVPFRRCMR